MNSSIENYTRQQITEGLTALPESSQRVFKLMYGRKGGKRPVEESVAMPIGEVVAEIPAEKLDWALTQIQNSHDKLAQGGQQVSEPRVDVKCECGASMLNRSESTPQWAVYDTTCTSCGRRSEKAAKEVREIVLGSLTKGGSK